MQDRIDEGEPESTQRRNVAPEDELPPKLDLWRWLLLWFARIILLGGIGWLLWVCYLIFWNPAAVPECVCWSYLALGVFLTGLVSDFIIRHKILVHKKRKEDRSEIEALMLEVRYVRPRLTDPERPAGFDGKREQLEKEVKRLEDDVGPEGWTEFQVLTLDRMLIDFLPLEDLKARARSSLDELKEYAYGEGIYLRGKLLS